MKVNVLSADKVLAETEASEVNLPGTMGYMGILEDHAPMIAEMGPGALSLKSGSSIQRYFVSGGFVEVTAEDVRILVDSIEPEAKIDFSAVEKERDELVRELETSPDWDAKAKLQARINLLEAKLTLKQ